jgi:hypothetical protein
LTKTHKKYSAIEIEVLAIVEVLKEFKGMLWGQRVKVYADHKNLMQIVEVLKEFKGMLWGQRVKVYMLITKTTYVKGSRLHIQQGLPLEIVT